MSTETTPSTATETVTPTIATIATETPTVVTTPVNAPSEAEVNAAIDSMGELTAAQLEAIEAGDFSGLAPTAKGDEKPKETTETTPTPTTTQETDKTKVHRLSLGGLAPESRAKFVEMKSLVAGGMSEAEAAAKVFGVAAAPAAKETETPTETETPSPATPPPALQALQDQIAAKQAEIKAVKDEFGDTTELLEQLQDLKLDLRDAKREHEKHASTAEVFQSEVNASLKRAMSNLSELWSDPKAEFESKCDDEFLLAQAKNDPVLQASDWPEKIANRVKVKFFSGYDVNNAGGDDDEPTIPPLPNQRVRLPGSLTGQTAAPGTLTPGNVLATFESLTEDEQLAVLKNAG